MAPREGSVELGHSLGSGRNKSRKDPKIVPNRNRVLLNSATAGGLGTNNLTRIPEQSWKRVLLKPATALGFCKSESRSDPP